MSKQEIKEWLASELGYARNLEETSIYSKDDIVNLIERYTKDQSADLNVELEDIIGSRDYWEEKATELANDIGGYHNFQVGEHSNINNPVQNAIDTLYCIKNKIGNHANTNDQSEWVSDHTVASGSLWEHKNDNEYEVITIANSETKTDRYPVTVVYKNISNGVIWSRELSDWHRSMTPLPPTQEA